MKVDAMSAYEFSLVSDGCERINLNLVLSFLLGKYYERPGPLRPLSSFASFYSISGTYCLGVTFILLPLQSPSLCPMSSCLVTGTTPPIILSFY